MKRDIVWTTKFKKDYKLAMKRHMDIGLLDDIIRALSRGEKLPEKIKDHELTPVRRLSMPGRAAYQGLSSLAKAETL